MDNVKSQAEELILKGFPEKIVVLNDLLATEQFQVEDVTKIHQDINIPIPEAITLNRSDMHSSYSNIMYCLHLKMLCIMYNMTFYKECCNFYLGEFLGSNLGD